MSILVCYADARLRSSELIREEVDWHPNLSIRDVISAALGSTKLMQIENDLTHDRTLTISWVERFSEKHSEIGGIGDLNWSALDDLAIAILYFDESTTPETFEIAIKWMNESYSM